LAQSGISRFFREIWLYFERSEMRENGLFLEKHHTILRQRRCFGEITQAKSGFIENLLFYSAPENTKKGKGPGAGIGWEGNDSLSLLLPLFYLSFLFLFSYFLIFWSPKNSPPTQKKSPKSLILPWRSGILPGSGESETVGLRTLRSGSLVDYGPRA
jgi:hypothetical protein